MRLLAERTAAPLRGRLVKCPCDMALCEDVFVLVQLTGSREALWMTMGICGSGQDDAAGYLDAILDEPLRPLEHGTIRDMIEHAIAMIGMTWRELGRDVSAMEEQILAWAAIPEWMERLPAGLLWRTRGVVFGDSLTRVVCALYAADYHYVPDMDLEGARLRPGPLEQPQSWGLVDHPLQEKLALPKDWYA